MNTSMVFQLRWTREENCLKCSTNMNVPNDKRRYSELANWKNKMGNMCAVTPCLRLQSFPKLITYFYNFLFTAEFFVISTPLNLVLTLVCPADPKIVMKVCRCSVDGPSCFKVMTGKAVIKFLVKQKSASGYT